MGAKRGSVVNEQNTMYRWMEDSEPMSKSAKLIERVGKAVSRPKDAKVEHELEQLSRIMDTYFRIPVLGWRFGLNFIIDLIPGVGDWATSIVALVILVAAVRYRVSKVTLLRMGLNIAIYFVIGLLPFIGDLLDAWWKPNRRNLSLLESRATVFGPDAKKARTSDWLFVGFIVLCLLGMLAGSLVVTYLILHALITQFHTVSTF
ncbi:MAG TPA: DUF4112 domain-containing protein [Blastocatellia bacterium]|nr:DUF4112 domain-containing protein [Blastocatellia bacterium]